MTTSQITHSLLLFLFIHLTKAIILFSCWCNKIFRKNKQNMRIYRVCACVLALRNLITIVRQRRIIVPFTIRILNPKYLNDDDNERERGRERINTRIRIQERRHLPFSNSIRIQRETFDENAHNLHKALSNRGKKKKWIFRQKSSWVGKEERKNPSKEERYRFFSMCIRLKWQ
jgi:hypothetical protein